MAYLSAARLEELDGAPTCGEKPGHRSILSVSTGQCETNAEGSVLAPTLSSFPAMRLLDAGTTDEELWMRRVALLTPPEGEQRSAAPAMRGCDRDGVAQLTIASLPAFCAEETDEQLWTRRVSLLDVPGQGELTRTWQGLRHGVALGNVARTVAGVPTIPAEEKLRPPASGEHSPEARARAPQPPHARKANTDVNCAAVQRRDVAAKDQSDMVLRTKLQELKMWRAIVADLGALEGLVAPDVDVLSAMRLMDGEAPEHPDS